MASCAAALAPAYLLQVGVCRCRCRRAALQLLLLLAGSGCGGLIQLGRKLLQVLVQLRLGAVEDVLPEPLRRGIWVGGIPAAAAQCRRRRRRLRAGRMQRTRRGRISGRPRPRRGCGTARRASLPAAQRVCRAAAAVSMPRAARSPRRRPPRPALTHGRLLEPTTGTPAAPSLSPRAASCGEGQAGRQQGSARLIRALGGPLRATSGSAAPIGAAGTPKLPPAGRRGQDALCRPRSGRCPGSSLACPRPCHRRPQLRLAGCTTAAVLAGGHAVHAVAAMLAAPARVESQAGAGSGVFRTSQLVPAGG